MGYSGVCAFGCLTDQILLYKIISRFIHVRVSSVGQVRDYDSSPQVGMRCGRRIVCLQSIRSPIVRCPTLRLDNLGPPFVMSSLPRGSAEAHVDVERLK